MYKNLLKRIDGKRLLIFDFDGTLADTTQYHSKAFGEALAPFGIMADYSRLIGLKTVDAILLAFSDAGMNPPDKFELTALVENKQKRAREMILDSLQPLPSIDKFLKWARPRYRMAIVSSGSRRTVEPALAKLGYAEWFSPILCAEDVAFAKPHPEGFLRVLAMTCVDSGDAVVFEDSDVGFAAASGADIDTIDIMDVLVL